MSLSVFAERMGFKPLRRSPSQISLFFECLAFLYHPDPTGCLAPRHCQLKLRTPCAWCSRSRDQPRRENPGAGSRTSFWWENFR